MSQDARAIQIWVPKLKLLTFCIKGKWGKHTNKPKLTTKLLPFLGNFQILLGILHLEWNRWVFLDMKYFKEWKTFTYLGLILSIIYVLYRVEENTVLDTQSPLNKYSLVSPHRRKKKKNKKTTVDAEKERLYFEYFLSLTKEMGEWFRRQLQRWGKTT